MSKPLTKEERHQAWDDLGAILESATRQEDPRLYDGLQNLLATVADLERQLEEAQAEIIAQKRITESIINVDVAGLRKAWKAAQAERDEAQGKLAMLTEAGVTDYSKLTGANRVDCHFCNGVWRTEEPAKHKSMCPLDRILRGTKEGKR